MTAMEWISKLDINQISSGKFYTILYQLIVNDLVNNGKCEYLDQMIYECENIQSRPFLGLSGRQYSVYNAELSVIRKMYEICLKNVQLSSSVPVYNHDANNNFLKKVVINKNESEKIVSCIKTIYQYGINEYKQRRSQSQDRIKQADNSPAQNPIPVSYPPVVDNDDNEKNSDRYQNSREGSNPDGSGENKQTVNSVELLSENIGNFTDTTNNSISPVTPERSSDNSYRTDNVPDEQRRSIEEDAESSREKTDEYARKVRSEADDYAKRVRAEADEYAKGVWLNNENKKKEERNKSLADDLNRRWLQTVEQINRKEILNRENITRAESEREEIWTKTSRLQGDIVNSIERMTAEVTGIKQELCQQLIDWRNSLAFSEFSDLATVYAGLYRFQYEINRLPGSISELTISEKEREDLINIVKRLQNQDMILQNQMIRALSSLGLVPIQPNEGDQFDPEMHEITDQQQETGVTKGAGRRIKRCVLPGVAVTYKEPMREDTAVKKAKVEIDI